eukprot:6201211-Pleurochrysis_carterae.AAC.1
MIYDYHQQKEMTEIKHSCVLTYNVSSKRRTLARSRHAAKRLPYLRTASLRSRLQGQGHLGQGGLSVLVELWEMTVLGFLVCSEQAAVGAAGAAGAAGQFSDFENAKIAAGLLDVAAARGMRSSAAVQRSSLRRKLQRRCCQAVRCAGQTAAGQRRRHPARRIFCLAVDMFHAFVTK